MGEVSFSAETYRADINTRGIASLTASYGETIAEYRQPIDELNQLGYDVAAYDYSAEVLLGGDPNDLVQLVDDVHDDFANKAENYRRQRHTGASLGSLIAVNMQWREEKAATSLLTTAGVPLSDLVSRHPIFTVAQPVWRAFRKKGFEKEDLAWAWEDIQVTPDKPAPPDKPLVIVLGTRDCIVPRLLVRKTEKAWRAAGSQFEIIEKPFGHTAAIRWFKQNIGVMEQAAAKFDAMIESR